jgi:hypothetical protein
MVHKTLTLFNFVYMADKSIILLHMADIAHKTLMMFAFVQVCT